VFLERCAAFAAWLAARPERSIAVVTHWGVIDALTSIEFENCEACVQRCFCLLCTVLTAPVSRAQVRTFALDALAVRAPREGSLVPPG
jgi:hypothetical protein